MTLLARLSVATIMAAMLLPSTLTAASADCAPGRLMDSASVTMKITPQGLSYSIKLQRDDVIYTVEVLGRDAAFDPAMLTNRESLMLCVADKTLSIARKDGSKLQTRVVSEVSESNY